MRFSVSANLLLCLCFIILGCSPGTDGVPDNPSALGENSPEATSSNNTPVPEQNDEPAVEDSEPEPVMSTETPTVSSSASSLNVSLESKSWEEIKEWAESQTGRVVVIDVWSTFCLPCVKEFPKFVEFHEKYQDRVSCASLNINYYGGKDTSPEEARPQVQKFLATKDAKMTNFLCTDPDEVVLTAIETAAIPAAIIFDKTGKLHKVFNNDEDTYGPDGFHYEKDIVPVVEELLKAE